jgi:hypothetical protein
MIHKGTILAFIGFGSSPNPLFSYTVGKFSCFLSLPVGVSPVEGGRGGAKSYDRQISWSSLKFNTLILPLLQPYINLCHVHSCMLF